MIVLGLDPGTRHFGWGVVWRNGTRLVHVAHGVIDTDLKGEFAGRLVQLQGMESGSYRKLALQEREKTIPLLDYYAGREWMFTVDGAQPAEVVHDDIVGRLRRLAALAAEAW